MEINSGTISPQYPSGGTLISDYYAQLPACIQDNITSFKTNSTYIDDEGATKCIPSDPQIIGTGSWAFNSTESTLTLDAGTSTSTEYKILQLDASTFKFTETFTEAGIVYTITETATH